MTEPVDELAKRRAKSNAREADAAESADLITQLISRMNAVHAVVTIGGKTRIMTERPSTENPGRINRTFSIAKDFELQYTSERFVIGLSKQGTEIIKTADKIWLQDPRHRQYDDVIFNPLKPPGGDDKTRQYNMYRGMAVDITTEPDRPARMKKWKLTYDHILKIVCNGNEDHFKWVCAWIAERFKHPDRMGQVAIVLMGDEGIGKGTFATDIIGGCYDPQHFAHVTDQDHLIGRFNFHLADALMIFADEAIYAGDPRAVAKLYGMVTEKTSYFEPKGVNALSLPTHRSIIVASNDALVIPAKRRARRFTVLKVSEKRKDDHAYFAAIREELANGGREEMMRYLLQTDFGEVNPYKLLHTAALMEQKELNFKGPERWIFDKLLNAELPGNHGPSMEWTESGTIRVDTSAAVKDYLSMPHMLKAHETRIRAAETELEIALTTFIPSRRAVRVRVGEKRIRVWEFPDLKTARGEFNAALGAPYSWDDPEAKS